MKIVKFVQTKHKHQFINLNIKFLGWVVDEIKKQYKIDLVSLMGISVEEYIQTLYEDFIKSYEINGIIYILEIDGKAVGMGGIRKLEENICEIKRMYILPEFRGLGFGIKLFEKLIESAGVFGYSLVRLETSVFMHTAQHIYSSHGFKKCEEYLGVETPEPMKPYTLFMERKL